MSSGVKGLDESHEEGQANQQTPHSTTTDTNAPQTSSSSTKRSSKHKKVSATSGSSAPRRKKDKREVVKRLESGGRILSLIQKAETKRVAKRKIITFLKKKGVSESKIIEAYSAYYEKEGLYEITFNQRPLGFSVIMDTRGKNAIVSSIQDSTNDDLGMKVASRIYEINGKRVDDVKHKDILKLMAQQPTPFYVVFKESKKKNSKLDKRKQKIAKGLQWQQEDDDTKEEDAESVEESDSDTISSYDSDDDEAHVAHHYSRKDQAAKNSHGHNSKKRKKKHDVSASLFKPHELDQWDDNRLEDEQAAMLKQLSRLMMGAVAHTDQQVNAPQTAATAPANSSSSNMAEIDGMTHKRKNTLKTLLDVTADAQHSGGDAGHHLKKSITSHGNRKFSVSDLETMEEDEEYDPEIFKYLSELVGDQKQNEIAPLTPSTSKLMKDLFTENMEDEVDVVLNLPEFGTTPVRQHEEHLQNYPSTDSYHSYQSSASASISELKAQSVEVEEVEVDGDEDVIESLEQGTTLLKYGKYGKPKYKMFHLTPDHKYLVWFSPKKSSEETRIRIKEIRKIAIGSDSKVVEKTKQTDLHETSFTIFYGKAGSEKQWKSLTVTAKNEKEAFVWAQGLKILSDASKQGKHLRTLSTNEIPSRPADGSGSGKNSRASHKKHGSVIISIDKLQKQSVLNLFSKSSSATTTSLLKQHSKHKQQLQKCVDFVMTKTNYRAIANAGQFDKVKLKLEDLDNRLRDIKMELTSNNDMSSSDLSAVKAELFSCAADLDALKQKLTALVRRPQRL